MSGFTAITVGIVYVAFIVSVIIYVLLLLIRLVKAHETGAAALQSIAEKYQAPNSNRS